MSWKLLLTQSYTKVLVLEYGTTALGHEMVRARENLATYFALA